MGMTTHTQTMFRGRARNCSKSHIIYKLMYRRRARNFLNFHALYTGKSFTFFQVLQRRRARVLADFQIRGGGGGVSIKTWNIYDFSFKAKFKHNISELKNGIYLLILSIQNNEKRNKFLLLGERFESATSAWAGSYTNRPQRPLYSYFMFFVKQPTNYNYLHNCIFTRHSYCAMSISTFHKHSFSAIHSVRILWNVRHRLTNFQNSFPILRIFFELTAWASITEWQNPRSWINKSTWSRKDKTTSSNISCTTAIAVSLQVCLFMLAITGGL